MHEDFVVVDRNAKTRMLIVVTWTAGVPSIGTVNCLSDFIKFGEVGFDAHDLSTVRLAIHS